MAKLVIPAVPRALHLHIERYWNGQPCDDARYGVQVWLNHSENGLTLKVTAAVFAEQRIPDAPTNQPCEGLWDYDVVELFLVAENGQYLEVELGAGGHWLALSFDGVRHRSNSYPDFVPKRVFEKGEQTWTSSVIIPWSMIPRPISALNAFAICQGSFLAYNPVPGPVANYHQPQTFPAAELLYK